ncbi:hypothetical protein SDC9_195142 [bioreactor metagenome]|uniref:Uncharacterized protein n=1 Tax=bioreactor metagenome TaxID=1076179 RepID=A0A645IAR4_9ZZZZ
MDILAERGDLEVRVEHFERLVGSEERAAQLVDALYLVEEGSLLLVVGQAHPQLLEIVQEFDRIFHHAGDRLEFARDDVLRALVVVPNDADGGDRVALD